MLNFTTYLLQEDRVDFLWNQYKDWFTKKSTDHDGNVPDEYSSRNPYNTFTQWVETDPTPNKQYLQWILKTLKSGGIRGLEDHQRVNAALTLFNTHKVRLDQDKRDINKYKTLQDLERVVEPFETTVSNRQQQKFVKQKGAEKLYEDNDWLVVKVTTPEAACYYGKNTKWCTSNSNTASSYLREYEYLLLFFDKSSGEKFQATPDLWQFMDERDNAIMVNYVTYHHNIVKLLKESKIKLLLLNLIKSTFSEEDNHILANYLINYAILTNSKLPREEENSIINHFKNVSTNDRAIDSHNLRSVITYAMRFYKNDRSIEKEWPELIGLILDPTTESFIINEFHRDFYYNIATDRYDRFSDKIEDLIEYGPRSLMVSYCKRIGYLPDKFKPEMLYYLKQLIEESDSSDVFNDKYTYWTSISAIFRDVLPKNERWHDLEKVLLKIKNSRFKFSLFVEYSNRVFEDYPILRKKITDYGDSKFGDKTVLFRDDLTAQVYNDMTDYIIKLLDKFGSSTSGKD